MTQHAKGIRVAFTCYVQGSDEQTWWFTNLPQVPIVGDSVCFNDYHWRVDRVSWMPDHEDFDPDTTWHVEIGVSR